MVPDVPLRYSGATIAAGPPVPDVGARVELAPPSGESDFVDLARQVRAAGLFCRTPWHSVTKAGVIGGGLVVGWVALFWIGDSWYQVCVAAFLAVVLAQLGFLGHEVGHRQFFRSRRLTRLAGLACANLGTGISFSYWVDKHDRHHGHPNEVGIDPDVAPGVFSWTAEQTANKTGAARLLARHQAALFFPVLLLEGMNLHVASARALHTKRLGRKRIEGLLLALHAAAYLVTVSLLLSPLRAVVFVLVQQGLFGLYLGCAFAPNHKGMAMPARDEALDFLRRQVSTSRNVRGSRALDVAMGGLNYQIEHHLFPTMPMANLRRCRPMVRAYCSRLNIDYCETGLVASYVVALRHLRATGMRLRPPAVTG